MLHISFHFEIQLGNSQNEKRAISFESWRRLQEIVKRRDGGICQYCGHPAPDGHVDHRIPLSRGGTDSLDNLVWSCQDCNLGKGNKTPEEWRHDKATSLVLEVTKRDDNGVMLGTDSLDIEGIGQEQLLAFGRKALEGGSLAVNIMAGGGRPFSQGQYQAFVDKLILMGYMYPSAGSKPPRLTDLGQSVFEQLLATNGQESPMN